MPPGPTGPIRFDPTNPLSFFGFSVDNIPFVDPTSEPLLDVDKFVRRNLRKNADANGINDGSIRSIIAGVKGLLGRITATMANGISESAMVNLFKNMASLNIALFAKAEIGTALDMSTDNPELSGDITGLNTAVTTQVGLAQMAVNSWRDILKSEKEQSKPQQFKRL